LKKEKTKTKPKLGSVSKNGKVVKNQVLKILKTTQLSSKPNFIIFHGSTLVKIHTSSVSLVWSLQLCDQFI
jgi:hypothetical protein